MTCSNHWACDLRPCSASSDEPFSTIDADSPIRSGICLLPGNPLLLSCPDAFPNGSPRYGPSPNYVHYHYRAGGQPWLLQCFEHRAVADSRRRQFVDGTHPIIPVGCVHLISFNSQSILQLLAAVDQGQWTVRFLPSHLTCCQS